MSSVGAGDLLTVPIGEEQVKQDEYLSDVSPRHKPWDQHRAEANDVREVYAGSRQRQHWRYAERVEHCSQILEFARDPPKYDTSQKITLKRAHFCHVRFCPVCQWRLALKYQAIVYQSLPRLMAEYPESRFLFLTLTIRNCRVDHLRYTLGVMARGWQRLTQLRVWPAVGWVRGVEITRGRDGSAHPHYHCLLMVPPAYFQADYLKQRQWAEQWQQCLRINYRPVVDIRVVKQSRKRSAFRLNGESMSHMWLIVTEILKYSVKASDMVKDDRWFLTLTDQVRGTRAVAMGGVLKRYFRARRGKADLTSEPGEAPPPEEAERLFFGWKQEVRRYRRVGSSGAMRTASSPTTTGQSN
jgi:plasmid rolling circle replication initiator protein Rep